MPRLHLNKRSSMLLAFGFVLLWGLIHYSLDVFFQSGSTFIKHLILFSILAVINLFWGWMFGSLYERAYHESITDSLTQLYSKKYFNEKTTQELSAAKENESPLSVAVLDIDNFKGYNDTYGHLAGDKILETIAATFRSNIREKDTVARFGGDEFVFLFPFTPKEEAEQIIRRISTAVQKSIDNKVSFSIGLATYPDDGLTFEELLHTADQNMYCCKTKDTQIVD